MTHPLPLLSTLDDTATTIAEQGAGAAALTGTQGRWLLRQFALENVQKVAQKCPGAAAWEALLGSSCEHLSLAPLRIGTLPLFEQDIPWLVQPPTDRATIILSSRELAPKLRAILEGLALRAILSVRPGLVRAMLADGEGLPDSFTTMLGLPQSVRGERVAREADSITRMLREIQDGVDAFSEKVMPAGYGSIEAYNESSTNRVKRPYTLLLLANFPVSLDAASLGLFRRILRDGGRAGYGVLACGARVDLPATLREDLAQFADFIEVEDESLRAMSAIATSAIVGNLDRVVPRAAVEAVLTRTQRAETTRVPFELPTKLWCETSAASVKTPIGARQDGHPQVFELATDGTRAHALVCGMTGSGKSWFLHSVILGMAVRYSPGELKFVLLDFKDLAEFAPYTELPHALLVTHSDRDYATLVLEGVERELKRRSALFGRHGGSLGSYRQATQKQIPRIVVVLDEFQSLLDDADYDDRGRRALAELLSKGRSAGIHIILATQTLKNVRLGDALVGQVGTRVALRLASDDDSSSLFGARRPRALELQAGMAILNAEAGLVGHDSEFVVADAKSSIGSMINELRSHAGPEASRATIFDIHAMAPMPAKLPSRFTREHHPSDAPALLLGESISFEMDTTIDHDPRFVIEPSEGRSILVAGQNEKVVASVLITLATSYLLEGGASADSIFFISGERRETAIEKRLGRAAQYIESLAPGRVKLGLRGEANIIEQLENEMAKRIELRDRGHHPGAPLLVMVVQPRKVTRERVFAPIDDALPVPVPSDGMSLLEQQRAFLDEPSGFASGPAATENPLRRWITEGPELGIHLVVWVDRFATAWGKWIERGDLARIDGRIAVQGGDWDSDFLNQGRRSSPGPTVFLLNDRRFGDDVTRCHAFDWDEFFERPAALTDS